jgi:hypothetical protein
MARALALAGTLLAALAAPLQAQVEVGLSAFAGAYLPLRNLFDSVRLDETGPIVVNLGHVPGLLAGGRLTARFSRLAAEVEAGYAFSDLDVPEAAQSTAVSADATVFLGSLGVVYDFYRAPFSPLSMHVSGGVGLVARGGDFFERFGSTTSVAAAVGIGVRYGIAPAIYLRFDLRDYISSFSPSVDTFEYEAKLQNDLILTAGVELSLAPAR